MNVVMDREIWESPGVDALAVVSILGACAARRHTLIIHPRDRPAVHDWLTRNTGDRGELRRRLARVIEEATRAASQAISTAAQLTVIAGASQWAKARLSPDHAARLLQRPLKLLVENARNDRSFLLCLAEPSSRRALERAMGEGWIEFEMGGGLQEIRHRLQDLATREDPEALIARARLWVMFDRDSHPEDRARESGPSREVRELAATLLTPWPLRAHQLERRAIENYVPLATLQRWWRGRGDPGEARLRVEAFGKLEPRIRHNFNMKRGLLGDLPQERRAQIARGGAPISDADLDPLFRAIAPSLRDALARGFDGLAGAFSTPGAIQPNDLYEEVSLKERRQLIESILERM